MCTIYLPIDVMNLLFFVFNEPSYLKMSYSVNLQKMICDACFQDSSDRTQQRVWKANTSSYYVYLCPNCYKESINFKSIHIGGWYPAPFQEWFITPEDFEELKSMM